MPSSSPRLVSINSTSGQALSRAQKRFNSLLKKIGRQRAELQAWEEKEPVFAEQWARDVAPLKPLHFGKVVEIIDLLDEAAGRLKLSRTDRDTLEPELCGMMESVLSEDVLDEVEYRRLQALFDKYSPLSLEEIRAEEQEDFKAQVLDEFGLDLGDLDIDMRDPGAALEQVLRKLEEQGWAADGQEAGSGFGTPEARRAGQGSRGAAGRAAPRADSRRTTAAEKKRLAEEAAQRQASRSVQSIFRRLASQLHPDRETNPVERARKTELMQRATTAYQANRLLDLLELQLEIEQVDVHNIAGLAESQLEAYNRVLKQQSEDLEHELVQCEMRLRTRYPINRVQKRIRPKDLLRILKDFRAEILAGLRDLDELKDRISTARGLRMWLKSLRRQDEEEEMAAMMAELMSRGHSDWP